MQYTTLFFVVTFLLVGKLLAGSVDDEVWLTTNNKVYSLYNTENTWVEAVELCKNSGKKLVELKSQKELEDIKRQIAVEGIKEVWTGAKGGGSSYYWYSGGSRYTVSLPIQDISKVVDTYYYSLTVSRYGLQPTRLNAKNPFVCEG